MASVKARGNSFYCEEQGDGPPILLIPPAGSTASTWGGVIGDLAGAGRVIAYDRRGYTRSGGEVVRSAAEHTRDAAAILDALDAGPAVVVGTSAGATIALDLAVRRPDLVRAVVVADLRATMGGHPRPQELAKITSPVVCTYGSRSRSYMRSITRALARTIPTARVREIDGTAPASHSTRRAGSPRSSSRRFAQPMLFQPAPRTEDSVRAAGDE